MANNTVSIILDVRNSKAIAGLKQFVAATKAFYTQAGDLARTYNKVLEENNHVLSETTSTLMHYGAMLLSVFSFRSILSSSYRFLSTIQDTASGLATMSYTLFDFGKGMTGFNKAVEFASGLQEKLRIKGMQTAATYEELSQTFQSAFAPAVKAGFDTDQVVEFVTAASQAASAMGIPQNMLSEEVRSILTGDMTAMNTRMMPLLTSVGLTNAKIKELIKTGQLYPALMEAFSGASLAAANSQTRLSVTVSNAQDAVQGLLGQALAPFWSEVNRKLLELIPLLYTVENKTIVWNEGVVSLVKGLGDFFGILVRTAFAVAEFTAKHAEAVKIATVFVITLASFAIAIRVTVFIDALAASIKALNIATVASAGYMKTFHKWLTAVMIALAAFNLTGWAMENLRLFDRSLGSWMVEFYARLSGGWKAAAANIGALMWDVFYHGPAQAIGLLAKVIGWMFNKLTDVLSNVPGLGKLKGFNFGLIEGGQAIIDKMAARSASMYKKAEQYMSPKSLALLDLARTEIGTPDLVKRPPKLDAPAPNPAIGNDPDEINNRRRAELEYALQLAEFEDSKAHSFERQKKALSDMMAFEQSVLGSTAAGTDDYVKQQSRVLDARKKIYDIAVKERDQNTANSRQALENEMSAAKLADDKTKSYDAQLAVLQKQKEFEESVLASIDKRDESKRLEQVKKIQEAERQIYELKEKSKENAYNAAKAELTTAMDAAGQQKYSSYGNPLKSTEADVQRQLDLQNQLMKLEQEKLATLPASNEEYAKQKQVIAGVAEKIRELTAEVRTYTASNSEAFSAGFDKYLSEAETKYDQMKSLAYETARAMESAFSDLFFDMMRGKLKSLGDYVQSFAESVMRAIANIYAQQLAYGLISGISSIGSSGTSGVASSTSAGSTTNYLGFDLTALSGRSADKAAASATASAPNVVINLTNNSSANMQPRETGRQFNGKDFVVGIVLEDISVGGPISKAVKATAKAG